MIHVNSQENQPEGIDVSEAKPLSLAQGMVLVGKESTKATDTLNGFVGACKLDSKPYDESVMQL